MEAPSPPQAPDPVATAQAQTQSNKETAIAQAHLNRINQYTPQGSNTYRQIGTNADGTPQYEQTVNYSPTEQGIYDANAAARLNVGNIARDQSQRIGQLLNSPFDLNSAAEARFNDMARQRLDPLWAQRKQQTETDLANRGIRMGSAAYDRAMGNFDQGRNDAYNSMFLQGRGQAVQEAMAGRNQPINEISALMSGSQVSQPNFTGVPQVGVANTDIAGINNQAFQNQMGIYNAQMSSNNAMMGGLAGLGGAALGMFRFPWSDRRLKRDIVPLGTVSNGLPEYEWTYIWGGGRYRGYMADEAEVLYPDAVHEIGGFKAIDYDAIARAA